MTQPNVPNGLQTGFESPEEQAQDKLDGKVNGTETNSRNDSPALENLNTVRSQEIMGKSVSGILILLLKWFKLSRELHNVLPECPRTWIFINLNQIFSSLNTWVNYY